MLIPHKGHTDTMQVYSVTVMTHVKALQAGHSSQGTSEPITPGPTRATYDDRTGVLKHLRVRTVLAHAPYGSVHAPYGNHTGYCDPFAKTS